METGTDTREGKPSELDATHGSGTAEGDPDRPGYLGFVAHEIRNPLSTALWTAELLVRMSPDDRGGARGDKLSAMCMRSLARVRQLVEDHFLCERLDVDGIPLRIESVGAREAIDAVVGRRQPGDGHVTVEVAEGLGVDVDRALLERAIDALVAVAGRDGTPVQIVARGEGDVVVLAVTGQPADEAATRDPVKGSPSDPTGRALSLPVARRIAAALHGELAVAGGGYILSLPRGKTYTARADPAAQP
jgi:K+-sensing histidine kinase KdpD